MRSHINKRHISLSLIAMLIIGSVSGGYFYFKNTTKTAALELKAEEAEKTSAAPTPNALKNAEKTEGETKGRLEPDFPVVHIKTPKAVKGIYISSWVGGTKQWRNRLIDFAVKNNINTVVIDIKDYTGYISFRTGDPKIEALETESKRIPDIKAWIHELHSKNIYVVGRISVFQDPLYTKLFPEAAIQTKTGETWKDRKGLSFVNPNNKAFWDYIVAISRASEKAGFDELNFDYIRFPTDGNMSVVQDILPPKNSITTKNMSIKAQVTEHFFKHLNESLKPLNIPISADIFGMVVINESDIGIGQQLEMIAKYFDYICPMIYPSHYPKGFIGLANPAAHPYKVIHHSMTFGKQRIGTEKFRPWIQGFNLGANYTPELMRDQKKALYDLGINDWLVWDPGNKYHNAEHEPQEDKIAVASE